MFDGFSADAGTAGDAPCGSGSRLYLDVAYAEKDEAKRLGARWDPTMRAWYVPAGVSPSAFARWLDPQPSRPAQPSPTPAISGGPGPTCTARLLAILERCWQCRRHTGCLLGILVPEEMAGQVDHPEGFVQFDLVAEALAAAVDPSLLRALRVGPLRLRFSRTVGSTYMSNGCCHCDALQGNFPLMEKLREFQADGGQLEELVVAPIEFPLVALPRFEDEDQ
jgi:hypothetical protein